MMRMNAAEVPPLRKFFTNPVVYVVLAGGLILWGSLGFKPFGFPEGEYSCTARSGVQEFPISVFHFDGQAMMVVEYRPGKKWDVSSGMTYSHVMFDRHLNLSIAGDGETYTCTHVG